MRKRIIIICLSIAFITIVFVFLLLQNRPVVIGNVIGAPIELVTFWQNNNTITSRDYLGDKSETQIQQNQDFFFSYKKRIFFKQSLLFQNHCLHGLLYIPNGLSTGYSLKLSSNEHKKMSLFIVPHWNIKQIRFLFISKYYVSLKYIKVNMRVY